MQQTYIHIYPRAASMTRAAIVFSPWVTLVLLQLLRCTTIISGVENPLGLYAHNRYRKIHCSQPLQPDAELTDMAQRYSRYVAETGRFEHGMLNNKKGQRIGQNLFVVWGATKNDSQIVDLAVRKWYKENTFYDYSNGVYSARAGHFTQLVWNATNRLGVGITTVGDRKVVIANYFPPGNTGGGFTRNVLPPCNGVLL